MKTVLITGGAAGIGKACAELFSKNNYLTLVNYRTSQAAALELKAAAIKDNRLIDIFPADISCEKQVQEMFFEIEKRYKMPDIIVNNAGVALIKEFADTTAADFDKVVGTNLKGAFLCAREGVKGMLKSGGGRIINVSSMWGLCGSSLETVYSAAKAGLIGLTKALAKEVAPSGISVNAVAPGFIDTAMNGCIESRIKEDIRKRTPAGRLGEAADIAKVIFYLASDAPDFLTGEVINISGGLVT